MCIGSEIFSKLRLPVSLMPCAFGISTSLWSPRYEQTVYKKSLEEEGLTKDDEKKEEEDDENEEDEYKDDENETPSGRDVFLDRNIEQELRCTVLR